MSVALFAQDAVDDAAVTEVPSVADSMEVVLSSVADSADVVLMSSVVDSTEMVIMQDSISAVDFEEIVEVDTVGSEIRLLSAAEVLDMASISLNASHAMPDPKKALWLAIVFPGGGQIYNRKYWKLPLIYGGFIGCAYALMWNGTMYRDYSQAYQDIMDNDPNSKSYEDFLPAGYDVNARLDYLQNLFKRKKDYFRRYRDLSIFCMIGVYLLSIVDAYVDAELSSFDISRDLTMKVRPAIFYERYGVRGSGMNGSTYGLQCSLSF